jgi:hypothetical protein
MYITNRNIPFIAGHEGAGVIAPALRWFFAEGATGVFFDTYLLIANPGAQASNVQVTYLLAVGSQFTKTYTIAPRSRTTIGIDGEDARLADAPVSMIVESTNNRPIIAERAMWWPSPNWYEAHLSAGATTTGTKWAIADGLVDAETETYVLIANTSAQAGNATVKLLFSDGTPAQISVPLPANSRVNVPISSMFPAFVPASFGVTVESDGPQIVVERSQYATRKGVTWSEGGAALAAKIQ